MQNDIVRQPPQPKDEPAAPVQPVQDVQPPQSDAAPQNIGEQAPVQSQPEQPEGPSENNQAETTAEHPAIVKHKSNKPIGVIVTAVIVCTGLAGGAIYSGMQQSGKSSNVATTNTTQPATTQADDALPEVEAALEETNNMQTPPQDMSPDMSDASLGL